MALVLADIKTLSENVRSVGGEVEKHDAGWNAGSSGRTQRNVWNILDPKETDRTAWELCTLPLYFLGRGSGTAVAILCEEGMCCWYTRSQPGQPHWRCDVAQSGACRTSA